MEEKLCPCGDKETEGYVTQYCIFTQSLKIISIFFHIQYLLSDKYDDSKLHYVTNKNLCVFNTGTWSPNVVCWLNNEMLIAYVGSINIFFLNILFFLKCSLFVCYHKNGHLI